MKKLSASLMCADLTDLRSSIGELEKAGIDYLHIDIMDGCFVPNITLGFDLVNSLKKITDIPLDIHMMVNEPSRFIGYMKTGGDDIITVHIEADTHICHSLSLIHSLGSKAGAAINPETSPESLLPLLNEIDFVLLMTVNPGFAGQKMFSGAADKVKKTRQMLDKNGYKKIPIGVDGNMSPENGAELSRSGADFFVLGTSGLFLKNMTVQTAAAAFRAGL